LFDYDQGALIWRRCGLRVKPGTVAGNRQANLHVIAIRGNLYTRGRLVWAWHYGEFPKYRLKHLNHDPHDDRIENLADLPAVEWRVARKERMRTLPTGVSRNSRGKRYEASVAGVHLGSFKSIDEAHAAYKAAHAAKYGPASRHYIAPGDA
jgi:hypothetical protein